MAAPLFIIGPQRNGTTILVKLLCMLPECGDGQRGFEPFDRWDIPFIGELGGDASRTPLLDGVRDYAARCDARYAAVRVALPWAWESLGWLRLLEIFPDAKFVLIQRNVVDAFQSWLSLPYIRKLPWPGHLLGATGHDYLFEAYAEHHFAITCTFDRAMNAAPGRVTALGYTRLVGDADRELAAAYAMLAVDPLDDAQQHIRLPKHWSGK